MQKVLCIFPRSYLASGDAGQTGDIALHMRLRGELLPAPTEQRPCQCDSSVETISSQRCSICTNGKEGTVMTLAIPMVAYLSGDLPRRHVSCWSQ